MTTPTMQATAAPIPAEIDPKAQTSADETARRAKERQQSGVTSTGTILTAGLDDTKLNKKSTLGA